MRARRPYYQDSVDDDQEDEREVAFEDDGTGSRSHRLSPGRSASARSARGCVPPAAASSPVAGVSRSWLYAQPDLRVEIGRLRAQQQEGQARASSSPPVPARQRASEASLRRRLEAGAAEIRCLRQENQQLREQVAWALGDRRVATHPGRSGWTTTGPCS